MSTFNNLLLDFLENDIIPKKTPKIKEILSKRKKTFIKEYLSMNNISMSSTCFVKTDNEYKKGRLTLINSKLVINQYESNKKNPIILSTNSITETIDIYNPIFFIDFNMVTCELFIHKKKQKFRIIILGKNYKENDYENDTDYIYKYRIVKFKMPQESKTIFNLLCENINKSIILSKGYKNNIFGINIRQDFCYEYYIHYKQFEDMGQTGDVLLFKGYSKDSKFQRFITDADYDHVALLIKNKKGLHVYESTGKDGVKSRPWQEFITYYWYLLYDIMSFRKLQIDANAMKQYISEQEKDLNMNEIIDNKKIEDIFYFYFNKKVDEFLSKTEDKQYYFSKMGVFCLSKMKKNKIIRNKYSCSELIAACYYYAGIITDDYEARNYLPGHFTKKSTIPFKTGFSLGVEYIIDFSSFSYK